MHLEIHTTASIDISGLIWYCLCWEVSNVLIQVKYPDNSYDYVKRKILDLLIELNKIVEFERSTGWVRIAFDPIRKTKQDHPIMGDH